MYITQEIADRIKMQAKIKGITIKLLLSDCNMGINAISEFSKGKQLSCISLAKIADNLDCSVDYLLGRTKQQKIVPIQNDESNEQKNINYSITHNNNIGDNIINNHSKQPEYQNEMVSELLKSFNSLKFEQKIDVFNYIKKLSDQTSNR